MPSRFSQRSEQIEIMDDLLCQGEVVDQTLRELEFINKWLGGNAVTEEAIRKIIHGHEKEIITIVDLGCGGGDMLKLLSQWGKKNGLQLKLTGIDANPHIIEFAKENCKEYPEIEFEALDIFSPEFQQRKYDVVMGTLFYHHFSSHDLVNFFSMLKNNVRIGFMINDIHRQWFAYHSIRLLTKYFSKSAMVKFDAPLSVLRAFSKNELMDIMSSAGIGRYQLKWKWAWRWQIIFSARAI